jgi:hypothetical protein
MLFDYGIFVFTLYNLTLSLSVQFESLTYRETRSQSVIDSVESIFIKVKRCDNCINKKEQL